MNRKSQNYFRAAKDSVEDLYSAATDMMEGAYKEGAKRGHITATVEIASMTDEFWQTFRTLSPVRKAEEVRSAVKQAISVAVPHAVQVTFKSNGDSHKSVFYVKLVGEDQKVKVIDEDANTRLDNYESNVMYSGLDSGLGTLGAMEVRHLNDRIEGLKEKHQEALAGLRTQMNQDFDIRMFKKDTELKEVQKELKHVKKDYEELETDYAELFQNYENAKLTIAEKEKKASSSLNGALTALGMGVASKYLDVDLSKFEGLSALGGSDDTAAGKTPVTENAGSVEFETAHPRDEEINVLRDDFFRVIPDEQFRDVITILQAFKEYPESIQAVINMFDSREIIQIVSAIQGKKELAATILEMVNEHNGQNQE